MYADVRHELQIPDSWSFSGACKLCHNFKPCGFLSSSETGVNPLKKCDKKLITALTQMSSMSEKPFGGIYFTKKRRAETPHPGLEF
jgi:hypothetical protein